MKKAVLLLENDLIFRGEGIGAYGSFSGELVFNTAMSGYVESLTDPSYAGQILTFAYPLIGNYGVNSFWRESIKIHPTGIVAAEVEKYPDHRKNQISLDTLLKKNNVGGIIGVDTRALVKIIRLKGTIPAVLAVFENHSIDAVRSSSIKKIKIINPNGKISVAVVDYGIKKSIIKELVKRKVKVILFPADSKPEQIMHYKPKGVILSNGPGDPQEYEELYLNIRQLLKIGTPIFGICLGLQFLALAGGGKTYKLKFGHRSVNQPIIDKVTKKAYITSQNHGYAVVKDSLPSNWKVSFSNLNDGTIEGLINEKKRIMGVQFHPEASPGPHDTSYLFDKFLKWL